MGLIGRAFRTFYSSEHDGRSEAVCAALSYRTLPSLTTGLRATGAAVRSNGRPGWNFTQAAIAMPTNLVRPLNLWYRMPKSIDAESQN